MTETIALPAPPPDLTLSTFLSTNDVPEQDDAPFVATKAAEVKPESSPSNWHDRFIVNMNTLDEKIDELMPNNSIQEKLDKIGNMIKESFSSLGEFNDWLEKNHPGDWHEQLATFLVKLPMRSARNVITLLYSIISSVTYASVHPIKGFNHIAKNIVSMVNELTKPQNWSKIGCGAIGVTLGQSFMLGNPLSVIGMGIGGAMILAGFTIDPLIAAVKAEDGKKSVVIKERLWSQATKLPESMLTGIFTGILIGGMRRAVAKDNTVIDNNKETYTYEKVNDVAQYGKADWNNFVETAKNISLEEAERIASNNPNITFFFYTKGSHMVLTGQDGALRVFDQGDAVFFTGEPWWGSANGLADGYIKH